MQTSNDAVRAAVILLLRASGPNGRGWSLQDGNTLAQLTPDIPEVEGATEKRLDRIAEIARFAEAWGWVRSVKVHENRRSSSPRFDSVLIGPVTLVGQAELAESEAGVREDSVAGTKAGVPAPEAGLPTDLRSRKEAADMLGVSEKTIREYVKNGILPSYGMKREVSAAEVQWLRDHPETKRKKRTP